MRDDFDKEFGDIEWMSDAEMKADTTRFNKKAAAQLRAADPAWREKVAENNRKKAQDPEFRKKLSESGKGRIMPDTWYENIRKSNAARRGGTSWNKGISPSDETRKKISEANLGKTYSAEHKKLLQKKCHKNKKVVTPEGTFCSMSEAGRYYWDNGLTTRNGLASTRMWVREHVVKDADNGFYFEKSIDIK
tara:strand:+ start:924 stop:1496 length:573 start_codon:yes stop_codon:yes gene_type:complete